MQQTLSREAEMNSAIPSGTGLPAVRGVKGGGLRKVKSNAERAIVVGVSILVVVELQPEGEGHHKQGNTEGESQTPSLMGECCTHLRVRSF